MTEFYKIKQKNGLTVLFEKRDLPVVATVVATKTGSAHEIESKKGMAHFFEHMPFKGTKTRTAKQISSTVEKVGGILNAFTSDEITAFWCKLPSKHFFNSEIVFDLAINPKLDEKDIEKERNIILSEISRVHDMPEHYLFDKIKELLYKKPFGMPVLGFKESVSNLRRDDFLKWHKFYCPKNLIVAVVGNVAFDDVSEMVKKYIKDSKKIDLPKPFIINKSGNFIETRHGLDQTHFALGFHTCSSSDKRRHAVELFNAILGEGMSSKLFQEVREKRGLAYSIHSHLSQERDYGYSIVYAGIEKKNIRKVKEIILKEIKLMSRVNARDLEDSKEQKIGNWELEFESCDKTAVNLIVQEMSTRAEDFYNYSEYISDVSLADVKSISKIKNFSTAVLASK